MTSNDLVMYDRENQLKGKGPTRIVWSLDLQHW